MKFRTLIIILILLLLLIAGLGYWWVKKGVDTKLDLSTPATQPIDPKTGKANQDDQTADANLKSQGRINLNLLSGAFRKIIFTRKERLLNIRMADWFKEEDRQWILLLTRIKTLGRTVDGMESDDAVKIEKQLDVKMQKNPQRTADSLVEVIRLIDEIEWDHEDEDRFNQERAALYDFLQEWGKKYPAVVIDPSLERK